MNIKKIILVFLLFFCTASVFASDVTLRGAIDETVTRYIFDIDDNPQEEIRPDAFEAEVKKPFLSDYIRQEEALDEDILLDTDFNPTYRVNQIKKVSTFSKSIDTPSAEDVIMGKGVFSVTSKSYQYNDTNTLNKNVRQELGATLKKDRFSVTSGLETTYDTNNINSASRGAFITPKLQLSECAAISFKNKISGDQLDKYEPLVGIDYTPKYLKNSSIWMGAGATIRDNNIQSQTFNLKTNFYLF